MKLVTVGFFHKNAAAAIVSVFLLSAICWLGHFVKSRLQLFDGFWAQNESPSILLPYKLGCKKRSIVFFVFFLLRRSLVMFLINENLFKKYFSQCCFLFSIFLLVFTCNTVEWRLLTSSHFHGNRQTGLILIKVNEV